MLVPMKHKQLGGQSSMLLQLNTLTMLIRNLQIVLTFPLFYIKNVILQWDMVKFPKV